LHCDNLYYLLNQKLDFMNFVDHYIIQKYVQKYKAKRWSLDGTFKVVADPFEQMWSIHAFVRSGDSLEQIPLVICLMSRRKTKDYITVRIFVLYNGLQSS
jgi:hypothetical protein